jgi:ADP-L-glycero-D-manno-heptose 6-epimerase
LRFTSQDVEIDRSADRPVVVTGSSGFIGGAIVRRLRTGGRHVVTVDLRGSPDHKMDATDPELLSAIRGGTFHGVVHQAGISNTLVQDADLLLKQNTSKPLALADACAAVGVPFIYASSFSVYGRTGRRAVAEEDVASASGPLNPYALSKLRLDEEMTTRYPGADWLGLRYTNVFGPNEPIRGRMASIISQWLARSARGETIEIFEGTQRSGRDYVEVDRIAAVIERRLDSAAQEGPRGVFNLGSGVTLMFDELIGWCGEFANGPLSVRCIPFTIEHQYQHWTEADMSRLIPWYPELPWGDREQLKVYAAGCWPSFVTNADSAQP